MTTIGSFPPTPGIYLPQRGQMIARNADGIRPFGPGTVGQVPTTQANGDVAFQNAGGGGPIGAYSSGSGDQGTSWATIPGLTLPLGVGNFSKYLVTVYVRTNNQQLCDISHTFTGPACTPYMCATIANGGLIYAGNATWALSPDSGMMLSNYLDDTIAVGIADATFTGVVEITNSGIFSVRFRRGPWNIGDVSIWRAAVTATLLQST